MKITEFTKLVAEGEGKKQSQSIAQIAETLKVADKLSNGEIYKVIRNLKCDVKNNS